MKARWKPDFCACGAKHPTISHNGSRGPWMCTACHRRAQTQQTLIAAQGALL